MGMIFPMNIVDFSRYPEPVDSHADWNIPCFSGLSPSGTLKVTRSEPASHDMATDGFDATPAKQGEAFAHVATNGCHLGSGTVETCQVNVVNFMLILDFY